MLVNILDQHPDIVCAGEIFKRKDTKNILHPEFSFDLPGRMESFSFKLSPSLMVRNHLKTCQSAQDGVFGFKLMTSQIEVCPQIEKALVRLGFKKIILIREDIAAQAISLELARVNKKWVNTDSSDAEFEKVNIHMQALAKTIGYFQNAKQKLRELSTDPKTLSLTYDQLMNQRSESLNQITDHLGLKGDFDYDLSLKPSSHLSYENRISNFSEVRSFLKENKLSI